MVKLEIAGPASACQDKLLQFCLAKGLTKDDTRGQQHCLQKHVSTADNLQFMNSHMAKRDPIKY
jgi:hypothetical protein